MNARRQQIYQDAYDKAVSEQRRRWDASYDELHDEIEARREQLMAARRRNQKRWFCEVTGCKLLAVRENAPICVEHNRRMHLLVEYPRGGAR